MKIRTLVALGGALAIALVTFLLWRHSPPDTAVAQTPAPISHPEQGLVDDLVLANRMLASQELGFLDAYGHVSVRSRINPNHFLISRYVSPGIVTAGDIIENDLDSKPVAGGRSDQYQERFLHGEIYRARPDVMAIVHSHTPELVAFSVSSVPLRNGDTVVPIFDIRKVNNGRSGIITTPALGQSFAKSLGESNSILLLGHGAVVVGPSIYNAVSSAVGLRTAARIQEQLISMGGTWDSNPRRVTASSNSPDRGAAPRPAAGAVVPTPSGAGGGTGADRGWEYWKQLVLSDIARQNSAGTSAPQAASTEIGDLVLANRMLASKELGILDAFGHVSVRSAANPNHYLISRFVSAGVVKASDISENDDAAGMEAAGALRVMVDISDS